MTLQRGEAFDRYRLEEPLGSGAFSEVWKASQLADGRSFGATCAVKIMRLTPDRAGSSPRSLAGDWLAEVRTLISVTDDAIPRILEANVWKDYAYIAMELLEGRTLAARLAQGPIPWRRAMFIASQIARALESAHRVGVIHRDLKPQNVMLAGANRVCVVDWGIASLATSTQEVAPAVARRPTTARDGTDDGPVEPIVTLQPRRTAVGTPGYMAPEVYEGARPAPAQDAFALGVVLYEMIAGCLPHEVALIPRAVATSDATKAYRAALDKATMDHTLVALRDRCPETPSGVIECIDALLERDPKRRPTQLRAVIEHANRFPHGIPDPPYVGLGTLGLQHAGLYFGQHAAIQQVLERLRSQRAVLLWGPSGCGKSSLALAGVAATMDRTLFLDMDGWTSLVIRPRDGQRFHVALDATPAPRSRIGQVVIVDQLEEIVDLDPKVRDMFCAAVLALMGATAPVRVGETVIGVDHEVRLIATVRDDLEWRVDREAPALRPLFERRVIVQGVDANHARNIIEEPARSLGYTVEAIDAVSREVAERLSSDPAKLPVVQYALSAWWEQREVGRRVLPVAAWNELGGVDGALSFVAEGFFEELDDDGKRRVEALFVRLFRRGRKQPLAESATPPADQLLMKQLIGLRLTGRREKPGSEPFYEAEHEYLAEHWPRLAAWLADARDDQALAEELERDAAAYKDTPTPERLWRKRRLAAAEDLARSERVVLHPVVKPFLQQSRRQERRGRRVAQGAIGIAVVVALLAMYTAVLKAAADDEHEQARKERLADEDSRRRTSEDLRIAKEARQFAEEDKRKAEVARHEADQELRSANETLASAKRHVEREAEKAARVRAESAAQLKQANEKERMAQAKVEAAEAAANEKIQKADNETAALQASAKQYEVLAKVAQHQLEAAEVRAKQAEFREAKAIQAALVYEKEARDSRQAAISCVR